MTNPQPSPSASEVDTIHQLLVSYSFDSEAYPTPVVIAGWLDQFGPIWVSHAITEALYQGRYKLISIDQILQLWQRRGQPIRHFNREFESIILGQTLLVPTGSGEGASIATRSKPAIATPSPPVTRTEAPAPQAAVGAAQPLDAAPHSPTAPETAPPAVSPVREDIPNFRPLGAALSLGWGQVDTIQPFVPRQDKSDLHQRLQAVVQAGMAE